MKLNPLFDKVVVEHVESAETTASGIVLPGQAKEKSQTARVIAVGKGGMVDGKEIEMVVKPGDLVIYAKYSGTECKIDGKDYVIIRQSDVLATVED